MMHLESKKVTGCILNQKKELRFGSYYAAKKPKPPSENLGVFSF
jgi:hypothetical protein